MSHSLFDFELLSVPLCDAKSRVYWGFCVRRVGQRGSANGTLMGRSVCRSLGLSVEWDLRAWRIVSFAVPFGTAKCPTLWCKVAGLLAFLRTEGETARESDWNTVGAVGLSVCRSIGRTGAALLRELRATWSARGCWRSAKGCATRSISRCWCMRGREERRTVAGGEWWAKARKPDDGRGTWLGRGIGGAHPRYAAGCPAQSRPRCPLGSLRRSLLELAYE